MSAPNARDRDRVSLSAAGKARRGAMLESLLGEMRQVRRRRARRRALRGAAALALAIVTLALPASLRRPGSPRLAPSGPVARTPASASVELRIVTTDPTILGRFVAPSVPRAGILLPDDRALLAELAAIDRPGGIIRTGGRIRVTGDVVDEL